MFSFSDLDALKVINFVETMQYTSLRNYSNPVFVVKYVFIVICSVLQPGYVRKRRLKWPAADYIARAI